MISNDGFKIKDGSLVRYTGNAERVIVPEGVTSIKDSAFRNCENITSFNCVNLREVYVPKSVHAIGESANKKYAAIYQFGGIDFSKKYNKIESVSFFT